MLLIATHVFSSKQKRIGREVYIDRQYLHSETKKISTHLRGVCITYIWRTYGGVESYHLHVDDLNFRSRVMYT